MPRCNPIIPAILAILAAFATGCAPQIATKVNFDTTEPLRVAVLPFITVDKSGKIINDEGRLFVDNIGLISSELHETPAQIVRRFTYAELEHTGLDVISQALVDIDLPHHGFIKPDQTLDMEKLYATKPSELCGGFLNCDAVLYGTVTEWDRAYYAIESVNSVGVKYKLVSAADGKILFSADAEDYSTRGITKGPTGLSDIVVAPIQGLDSSIIVEVAKNTVTQALAPLRIDSRPEFLQTSPPVLYAASHSGDSGPISAQSPLAVVLYGSPSQTAAFTIGALSTVPMVEETPGHYYGEYLPPAGVTFTGEPVTVALSDKFGRTSSELIPGATVTAK